MPSRMDSYYHGEADLAVMHPNDNLESYFASTSCQNASLLYSASTFQQDPIFQGSYPTTTVEYSYQPQPEYSHIPSYGPAIYASPAMSTEAFPVSMPMGSPAGSHFSQTPRSSTDYSLSPNLGVLNRSSRASSFTSVGAYQQSDSGRTNLSRSASPNASDLRAYGYLNKQGTWTCNYPGCTSKAMFTRGCDLRKHYKRHTKSFFCRHEGCPQATGGGFSSKKDLARHEAKHDPHVLCEWQGCDRVFSRVDNMRDHVKRIHLKSVKTGSPLHYSTR